MNARPLHLNRVAIVAILGTGLVHLGMAMNAWGDAPYKGVLFVANGVGSVVAAVGIHRGRQASGWLLGALIAAGTLAAYVASRTVGLPGLAAEPQNWLEPPGVASVVCELTFLVTFALARRPRPMLVPAR